MRPCAPASLVASAALLTWWLQPGCSSTEIVTPGAGGGGAGDDTTVGGSTVSSSAQGAGGTRSSTAGSGGGRAGMGGTGGDGGAACDPLACPGDDSVCEHRICDEDQMCALTREPEHFPCGEGTICDGEGACVACEQAVVELDELTPVLGSLCGLAFDHVTQRLWLYPCSAATVHALATDGTAMGTVDRPGESANDVDVDVAPGALTLDEANVPAGALLFVNGETSVAEVYAVDGVSGDVLATLTTDFGVSHVVGGAYHTARSSLFLVQDRVPATADANRIAEVDPASGAVLDSFQVTPAFDVNFGDVDVCQPSGNLLVVSSIESTVAEISPDGELVTEHALPAGVSSLSGIAIDDATGDAWVAGTTGTVWRLRGLCCGGVL